MDALKQYDERIARIMTKIEALRDRKPQFTCGKWPPVWELPLSEEAVAAFEVEKSIRLPEDYRRFVTTVAAAGSQPFYGLQSFLKAENQAERPFPYTPENFPYFLYMTEEEMDAFYGDEDDEENAPINACDNGLIPLCTEGDGMDSVLVVNSKDPEVYGTVWYYDLANDCGIIPMRDAESGKLFHFLDWLEYWADRTAGLGDKDYFSYAETVRLPDPPDNPDIMGRKMGWIE